MVKETITYVDYDGNERTEDFRFNISKAELAEWHLTTDGGMDVMIDRIVKAKDQKEIMAVFKKILMLSYGEKSPDGKRFIKSPELFTAFSQTEAYSKLFMELVTNEEKAISFVNSILPPDLAEELNK